MVAAVIAIGGNVGETPMPSRRFGSFQRDVSAAVGLVGGNVVAAVEGTATSTEWGAEASAWFAVELPAGTVDALRQYLARLCTTYEQDAIALTIGNVDLVAAA